jgi:hypothetical protein
VVGAVMRQRSVGGCSYRQVWDLGYDRTFHSKPGATLVQLCQLCQGRECGTTGTAKRISAPTSRSCR